MTDLSVFNDSTQICYGSLDIVCWNVMGLYISYIVVGLHISYIVVGP